MNHTFNNNVSIICTSRIFFLKKKMDFKVTTIDFIAKGSYTVSLSINIFKNITTK